jgi:hypothetical protein
VRSAGLNLLSRLGHCLLVCLPGGLDEFEGDHSSVHLVW